MYKTPGPQEEDINTMHRYRDAIVYQSVSAASEGAQTAGGKEELNSVDRDRNTSVSPKYASPYERTMFGAYVLFPYRNQEEYKQHRFYKSIDEVNIGGLPFLPSATDLVAQMLDELIADSPESAFERATLPRGIEEKLAKVDWKRRDVLIGTLRSKAQLGTCLKEKFYYIPKKLVSDAHLPIHYVALFQTPSIFSNDAGIYYYGEVLRIDLVKRKDIDKVPLTHGNPDELYYFFMIREWKQLDRPVLPKEKGVNSNYTNMFLLKNSEFIPELLLSSEEEYRMYSELKRRTGKTLEDREEKPGFEMGDMKVLFEDEKIWVYREGELADCVPVQEFSRRPSLTFRRLLEYLII